MRYAYRRCVRFADTDAAGVVHFAKLLCYVEEAEHECLVGLGIPLLDHVGWPRVEVECRYLAPLKMGDTVDVSVEVALLGQTSITWTFLMFSGERKIAEGKMKTVCVNSEGDPIPLPDNWRDLLLG